MTGAAREASPEIQRSPANNGSHGLQAQPPRPIGFFEHSPPEMFAATCESQIST